MARIHFFTEPNLLVSQQEGDEFGPVASQPEKQFNVTSMHSASAESKAYAVLPGTVRYQQDTTNPDLLNAVLKIDLASQLHGLPVKYLIYRGIKKNSLLQTNGTDLISAPSNPLHIANKVRDAAPDASTDYLTLGLGIKNNANPANGELQVDDDSYLDKLFTHNYSKTPWHVTGGIILGHFDPQSFGLEIVLESSWQKPKISIVRNIAIGQQQGHNITVNTSDPSYKQKADREAILNYLDPVCFWSSFYNDKIYTETQKYNSRDEVYEEIISLYYNKNRVYLDIRNANNLSLNYYDNYGQIGLKDESGNNTTTALKDYNTHSWPIHIMDSTDFISITQNEDSSKLQLALPMGDNTLHLCFIMYGRIYTQRSGFFGSPFIDFFLKESKIPKNEEQFLNLTENEANSNITNFFNLSTFLYEDDQHNKIPVTSYIRLLYGQQMVADPINENKVIGAGHVLDNLFTIRPLDELLDIKENYGMRAWLDGNMRYVARDDLNNKGKSICYSGIYQTGVAVDDDNITLFAIPFVIDGNRGDQVNPRTNFSADTQSFIQSYTVGKKLGLVKREFHLTQSETIELLDIYGNPDAEKRNNFDPDAFLGLTLTRVQYNLMLQNLSSFDNDLHPIFAQIETDTEVTPADTQTTNPNVRKATLQLAGYQPSPPH